MARDVVVRALWRVGVQSLESQVYASCYKQQPPWAYNAITSSAPILVDLRLIPARSPRSWADLGVIPADPELISAWSQQASSIFGWSRQDHLDPELMPAWSLLIPTRSCARRCGSGYLAGNRGAAYIRQGWPSRWASAHMLVLTTFDDDFIWRSVFVYPC